MAAQRVLHEHCLMSICRANESLRVSKWMLECNSGYFCHVFSISVFGNEQLYVHTSSLSSLIVRMHNFLGCVVAVVHITGCYGGMRMKPRSDQGYRHGDK